MNTRFIKIHNFGNMKIAEFFIRIGKWIKKWLWDRPTAKPPKTKPIEPKLTEVQNEYVVITYQGQKINLRVSELKLWEMSSRRDKRIIKDKFAKMIEKGIGRFETVNGKEVFIRNLDYQRRADKIKEGK